MRTLLFALLGALLLGLAFEGAYWQTLETCNCKKLKRLTRSRYST